MAQNTATDVPETTTHVVEGVVQTNTARKQDLVDAYYNGVKDPEDETKVIALSPAAIADKFNVRVSDVYGAMAEAMEDPEAKADLQRTLDHFKSRGE